MFNHWSCVVSGDHDGCSVAAGILLLCARPADALTRSPSGIMREKQPSE